MFLKKCLDCNLIKPVTSFGKNCRKKDGLKIYCKACRKIRGKEYYSNNREKCNAATSKWFQENKERHYATRKAWRQTEKGREYCAYADSFKRIVKRGKYITESQKVKIKALYATSKRMGDEWEVDHVIPINGATVCGLHVPDNLRIIRKSENRRKGAKLHLAI